VRRFRHAEAGPDAQGGGTGAASGGVDEHRSPGLKAALAGLSARVGCRVLDLGPALPANIDFLSGFASHLSIADLSADDGLAPGTDLWRRRLADIAGPFDLVLVWDLLSHLDRQQARDLVGWLKPATRQGGALFLLVHEGPEMPARPQVFEIRSDEQILYRPSGLGAIAAPRIPPAEVARLLSGFRIDASFVLRHGVREYVAVRTECDEDHSL